MKKMILGLCCILLAFQLCSCTRTDATPSFHPDTAAVQNSVPPVVQEDNTILGMENMPDPFDLEKGYSEGEERAVFFQPYRQDFYSVSSE